MCIKMHPRLAIVCKTNVWDTFHLRYIEPVCMLAYMCVLESVYFVRGIKLGSDSARLRISLRRFCRRTVLW